MSEQFSLLDWQSALTQTYQGLTKQAIDHLPQLLGALLLLLLGWIIALVLRKLTRRMVAMLNRLFNRNRSVHEMERTQLQSYGRIAGNIVFWAVLVFFLAASARILEWQLFANFTNAVLAYLPRVLTGLLIILAGFVLSGAVHRGVYKAADSAGVLHADTLARTTQVAVVVTAVVIGVEQLGVNVDFLTNLVTIILGVLFAGLALAFGLGSRGLVANIIGIQSARKLYHVGQHLSISDIEGRLLEITQTAIILDTENGRAVIPGNLIQQQISEIIAREEAVSTGSLIKNLLGKKGGNHESS